MKTSTASAAVDKRSKLDGWMVRGLPVVSFAAGSLLPVRLTRLDGAKADRHRLFELLIDHAAPGKGPALESLFRNASKIMAKDGVKVDEKYRSTRCTCGRPIFPR